MLKANLGIGINPNWNHPADAGQLAKDKEESEKDRDRGTDKEEEKVKAKEKDEQVNKYRLNHPQVIAHNGHSQQGNASTASGMGVGMGAGGIARALALSASQSSIVGLGTSTTPTASCSNPNSNPNNSTSNTSSLTSSLSKSDIWSMGMGMGMGMGMSIGNSSRKTSSNTVQVPLAPRNSILMNPPRPKTTTKSSSSTMGSEHGGESSLLQRPTNPRARTASSTSITQLVPKRAASENTTTTFHTSIRSPSSISTSDQASQCNSGLAPAISTSHSSNSSPNINDPHSTTVSPQQLSLISPSTSEYSTTSTFSQEPPSFYFRPAPVVTKIPAVPSEKERQRALEKAKERKERRVKLRLQKEKEEKETREKEERERDRMREEEKIWGIPKKKFIFGLGGLGEVNFNAQMAMLGGWGNGSMGNTDSPRIENKRSSSGREFGNRESREFGNRDKEREREREERGRRHQRKGSKRKSDEDESRERSRSGDRSKGSKGSTTASSSSRSRRKSTDSSRFHDPTSSPHRSKSRDSTDHQSNTSSKSKTFPNAASSSDPSSKGKSTDQDPAEVSSLKSTSSSEAEPLDPEELAALNAIINTRRSMAAAEALASGTIRPGNAGMGMGNRSASEVSGENWNPERRGSAATTASNFTGVTNLTSGGINCPVCGVFNHVKTTPVVTPTENSNKEEEKNPMEQVSVSDSDIKSEKGDTGQNEDSMNLSTSSIDTVCIKDQSLDSHQTKLPDDDEGEEEGSIPSLLSPLSPIDSSTLLTPTMASSTPPSSDRDPFHSENGKSSNDFSTSRSSNELPTTSANSSSPISSISLANPSPLTHTTSMSNASELLCQNCGSNMRPSWSPTIGFSGLGASGFHGTYGYNSFTPKIRFAPLPQAHPSSYATTANDGGRTSLENYSFGTAEGASNQATASSESISSSPIRAQDGDSFSSSNKQELEADRSQNPNLESSKESHLVRNASQDLDPDLTLSSDEEMVEAEGGEEEGWKKWYGNSGSGGKKWYLMGMPSSVFKPAKKHRSSSKGRSISSASRGSISDAEDLLTSSTDSHLASSLPKDSASPKGQLTRRLSTGTLGVMAAVEADRKNTNQKDELIKHQLMQRNSSNSNIESGATTPSRPSSAHGASSKPRGSSSRPGSSSGASTSSAKRRKANSRTAHALSLGLFGGISGAESESDTEEEPLDPSRLERERARKSELIRMSRPGGTGQVTLPDGTKIKARRVDDPDALTDWEKEEPHADEWGFAALAREARRIKAAKAAEEEREEAEREKRLKEEQEATEASKSAEKRSSNLSIPDLSRTESPDSIRSGTEAQTSPSSLPKVDSSTATSPSNRPPPRKLPIRQGSTAETGQTSGLGLSASRAEEVRRRHEMEVAALGADVLASIKAQQAKDRREKSASSAVDSEDNASSARPSNANPETPKARQKSWSSSDSSKANQPNPSTPLLRISSADSESSSITLERGRKLQTSPPASPASEKSAELPTSSTGSSRPDQPTLGLGRSSSSSSSLNSRATSQSPARSKSRVFTNPKVSVPAPSPWLPRRPDARGLVVVPLAQLGRRPKKPLEGRVWNFDVSDDESESEKEGQEAKEEDGDEGTPTEAKSKSDPEEESENESDNEDDLDPEEIAEEERRTAAQKKRATTKAAGAEVLRTGSSGAAAQRKQKRELSHSASSETSSIRSSVADSFDDSTSPGSSSVLRGNNSIASLPPSSSPSAASRFNSQTPSKSSKLRNTSSLAALKPASSPKTKKAQEGRGRSRSSAATTSIPKDDEAFEFDDEELWPSSMIGGKKSAASIARMKAARERREAEQRRAEIARRERMANDPENMDYGWPRSHEIR